MKWLAGCWSVLEKKILKDELKADCTGGSKTWLDGACYPEICDEPNSENLECRIDSEKTEQTCENNNK